MEALFQVLQSLGFNGVSWLILQLDELFLRCLITCEMR